MWGGGDGICQGTLTFPGFNSSQTGSKVFGPDYKAAICKARQNLRPHAQQGGDTPIDATVRAATGVKKRSRGQGVFSPVKDKFRCGHTV